MTRFTEHVLPRLGSVRAQVIHNDYHLYNVLVAPDDHERIVGIIDFGDMVHAPLVGELATAAAFQSSNSYIGSLLPIFAHFKCCNHYSTALLCKTHTTSSLGELAQAHSP